MQTQTQVRYPSLVFLPNDQGLFKLLRNENTVFLTADKTVHPWNFRNRYINSIMILTWGHMPKPRLCLSPPDTEHQKNVEVERHHVKL